MIYNSILSIIIPAYNVENYIIKTLESLAAQTEKRFEIIIVDDGSNDNTVEVSKEILDKNNFIKYKIIQKENGGVSSARNRGIHESSGEYVMFLDGDDYISDKLVETIYNIIESERSDIICWGFDIVDEDKKCISHYFHNYRLEVNKMTEIEAFKNIICYKNMWICTGSAAYKKELILQNSLLYTESCVNGEDQEFTFKVLSKSKSVSFINKVLFYYIQREGSISNSYDIKRFDAINALKRTYEYIDKFSNEDLKEVLNFLKYDKIVESYLYNLQSCLSSCIKLDIQLLLMELDCKYPGLNKEIISIRKHCKGKYKTLPIGNKLFLISPTVYFILINLKYKIKHLMKGMKR